MSDEPICPNCNGAPVFSSGREAREHGIRDIDKPKPRAKRMVAGLVRKRERMSDDQS